MIEQKPSSIEEAPSLSDIKSAKDDRLGRVDFTARLGARDDDADDPRDPRDPAGTAGTDNGSVVSLSSLGRPARATSTRPDGDDDSARLPFILPPAKVDEALAAEAQRTRRAVAEARGGAQRTGAAQVPEVSEVSEVSDDVEAAPVDALHPDAEEATTATTGLENTEAPELTTEANAVAAPAPVVEPAAASEPPRRSFRRQKPAPEPPAAPAPAAPAPTGGHGEGLRIQGVASLEEIAAEAAAAEAATAAAAQEAERLAALERTESEAAAAAEAAEAARLERVGAASDPIHGGPVEDLDDLLDEHLDGFDDPDAVRHLPSAAPVRFAPAAQAETGPDAPDQEVADVAASVIELMRNTQHAHQLHLESIELEAARRCELLTAQAELDAELIRLHARREAHAIVSAARMRVGTQPALPPEPAQLGEIGETFSRFAEAIETTVALGAASPDQTRKS